jgi:uridine kinase
MKPLIIGVAGGSGSARARGTQRRRRAREASVAFLDMDAYYLDHAHLPLEERRTVNWDHPNAFDWDLLVGSCASSSEGRAIDKPVYDFVPHVRSETVVRSRPPTSS